MIYNYKQGKKTEMQEFMVEKFRETVEEQNRSQRQNDRRIRDLLQRVQRLERQVWDRPNAVEDVGNA